MKCSVFLEVCVPEIKCVSCFSRQLKLFSFDNKILLFQGGKTSKLKQIETETDLDPEPNLQLLGSIEKEKIFTRWIEMSEVTP